MSDQSAVLITQCLQEDFVKLLDKYDPLPNLLHVGYQESKRLLGERVEEGPVNAVMHWAYNTPADDLALIHIRDWHNESDPAQADHLRQFGPHCIEDSPGAKFVFSGNIKEGRDHCIVNASGLNDFVETNLAETLDPYKGKPTRVGLIGVWTEAKITYLAYELKTRYPEFELALCSALTASSSRTMHHIALDQLANILGVKIFPSIGAFTTFLNGSMPAIESRLHSRLDPSQLKIDSENNISETDKKILLYLFRDCKEASFKSLDGGFSGNVVLGARALDVLGHTQVPSVVKIGPRDLIAEERASFERIQEVMGNSAPNITDFVEIGERGAIKYRYASMLDGNVRTFQDVYENSADVDLLSRFLDTVFNKQLGRLYEAAISEKLDLLDYYDFSSKYAGSIRRKTEDLLGRPAEGEKLELAPGIDIYNVCNFYEKDLKELKEYHAAAHYMAFLHGDLNGKNIIVDAQDNVWLIDFFHTHRGHVLKDLIKLENDILYIFTPVNTDEEFKEACELSRRLIDVADLGAPPPENDANSFRFPQFRKAWKIISRLRSLYPGLIQSDRTPYQLHTGLMRYAMHTLSFDESNEYQRRWALFSGALCARLIKDFLLQTKRLRVDFLPSEALKSPGRMGLTILPGRKDRRRNLEEDLTVLKETGITHVLCLISPDEFIDYGVPDLKSAYETAGLNARYFPILDQAAPAREEARPVLDWIDGVMEEGGSLLLHCVGGLGRSGLMAAAYLAYKKDFKPRDAIQLVRQSRNERAVETREQEDFVCEFD